MGNLSNNNGQSSSSNSGNNGGDNPKNEEYESQIKDLQEVKLKLVLRYSYVLFAGLFCGHFLHLSICTNIGLCLSSVLFVPWGISKCDKEKINNFTIDRKKYIGLMELHLKFFKNKLSVKSRLNLIGNLLLHWSLEKNREKVNLMASLKMSNEHLFLFFLATNLAEGYRLIF